MERRRADADPLGHVGGRGVRRSSQLQRRADRATELDRPRHGVRSQQAGSDDRAQRDAGRLVARGAVSRSGARATGATPRSPIADLRRVARLPRDPVLGQPALQERHLRSASTTRSRCGTSPRVAPRYDHDATGQPVLRADQGAAQELLEDQLQPTARHEGDRRLAAADRQSARAAPVRCWAGSSTTGSCRRCGRARRAHRTRPRFSYQNGGGNVNLTGSPDFGAAHPDRRRSGRQGAAATSTRSSTPLRSRGRWWAASGWSRPTTT